MEEEEDENSEKEKTDPLESLYLKNHRKKPLKPIPVSIIGKNSFVGDTETIAG